MAAGVPRLEAETGPHAHSITRWLGRDAPDNLTPHLTTVTATAGWLMVCSDGLWNYCSEAEALRSLLHDTAARLDDVTPTTVAQALVDFANEQGGRDNITVALARLAGRGSSTTEATASAAPVEGDPTDG
jgi:serine/threonine protein phosphatase PrpC